MISVYYARLITRELEILGVDLEELWHHSALCKEQLQSEVYLENDEFRDFLSLALALSKRPELGLLFGQYADAFSAGFAGLAAISAPSLQDCLQTYVSYSRMFSSAIHLELHSKQHNGQHYLCVQAYELEDLGDTRQTQLEVFMRTLQNSVQGILGRPVCDGHYRFATPPPGYTNEYPKYFDSPCHFNETVTAFEIPAPLGSVRPAAYNPELWQTALEQCNRQSDKASLKGQSEYTQRVREILRCSGPPLPKETDLAQAMHMSRRTLNRKLAQEGFSFRIIQQQVQMELVKQYLCNSDLTIDAIASLFGYQEPSNFRRAIRRFYNKTPMQIRTGRE
ncbi:AraC family transcriptional regulator [Pseudoteredinibacter isoporae]|uniref:AraC-like DNA-binding protein n=1 Tax=Pseudoteredinibacter isoporae TaxID=570281 RepID=A0A7X0JR32_9GAMM|nr:AraC family transcriptional regulator [Pseudoteredinibacter isoporae]MBB6519836.1 AraC-like DNA-binding protein [Pseudoteredinibacter isoporae]NHO85415.1 AraC family transcriptional regulator [Pseudoteredinibacter isoporae]NIB26133.1 AraC family transcriptional regulator [Pseudoteredinibacter isoporae]